LLILYWVIWFWILYKNDHLKNETNNSFSQKNNNIDFVWVFWVNFYNSTVKSTNIKKSENFNYFFPDCKQVTFHLSSNAHLLILINILLWIGRTVTVVGILRLLWRWRSENYITFLSSWEKGTSSFLNFFSLTFVSSWV